VSYSIRHARQNDLETLSEIEYRAGTLFETCLDATGLTPEFLSRVSTPDSFEEALRERTLWVAENNPDELVGFALVRFVGGLPHLDELDVLPEHGQRGIGSQLLAAVCAWAASAGHPALTLSTFRDVPWNAPFYARRGFRIISPADLSAEHVQLVADEAARGLRPDLRAVMVRALTVRSDA
jgi:GNAT superfamily N-acetyltransferase